MRRVALIAKLVPPAMLAGGMLLLAAPAQAQDAPRESIGPFFDIDWSVGLRGAYSADNLSGGHFEAILAPGVSFSRQGERDETSVSAGAALSVDAAGVAQVDDLHAGASATYTLDALSTLAGSLDLSLTQLRPDDPSLPTNTMTAPLDFTGTAEGSATRKLGQFDVTGRLKGERFIEGPTTLDDHSTIDNSDQSYWLGEAGLRIGYELTPRLSAFIDGAESYQKFDAASPSLLVYLDGRTTTLRGGLSVTYDSILSAEASVGRAWLDYTDGSLSDTPSWVYDASLTFNPDETVALTGSLETTLGPSDLVAGDTDVATTLTGTARYMVNPWLTLRGSAGWNRTVALGAGAIDWGYDAGAGFDLATSRHVVWSGDYLFTHDDPATGSDVDTHAVTLGVKVKR